MADPLADFAQRLQTHVDLGGAVTPMAVDSCALSAGVVVRASWTSPRVEAELAEALHHVMCDVSHHDSPAARAAAGLPERCSRWPKYEAIAASVVSRSRG